MAHDLKLVRTGEPCEGEKRQNIPYRIEWTCEECKAANVNEYADGHRYLSYPTFPGEYDIGLYCKECGHEETITLEVDITASIKES